MGTAAMLEKTGLACPLPPLLLMLVLVISFGKLVLRTALCIACLTAEPGAKLFVKVMAAEAIGCSTLITPSGKGVEFMLITLAKEDCGSNFIRPFASNDSRVFSIAISDLGVKDKLAEESEETASEEEVVTAADVAGLQ